jgi:hypothetical protein
MKTGPRFARARIVGKMCRSVLTDDDVGADRHPIVKIDHIVIDEAETA